MTAGGTLADDCPDTEAPVQGALLREVVICNIKGLHARASAKFVQCAETFDADIKVSRCGEIVSGTSIMGLLTLGAGIGKTISISATGPQAAEAVAALARLIETQFGEGE